MGEFAWPPDYRAEIIERWRRLDAIQKDPKTAKGAYEYYRTNPIDFIEHWCVTYDPRNGANGLPKKMPFVLFDRQKDLVRFLLGCLEDSENGLIEKSRDMGATWVCCAVSVWMWIYDEGVSVGWGSRKADLVDRLGDPDSIFEKIRIIINNLPDFLVPPKFSAKDNMHYMRIINPHTGATLKAESGDGIGRGGRSKLYMCDEAAHYERPELIEASLADNTNCRIDFSSVNGTANVFYRRRQAGVIWEPGKEIEPGKVRVMIMDWRDHPAKDQAWYDKRRKKAEAEGLMAVFAQEVDRDYAASVEGVIISSKWVRAAVDAHVKLGIEKTGTHFAGLDVADEGGDKNALVSRMGIIFTHAEHWGEGDTAQTATRAVTLCKQHNINNLQYDSLGPGSGIKGETNRLKREGILPKGLEVVGWAASGKKLNPEMRMDKTDPSSQKIKDFFENLKAQAWWELRIRFEKTYKAVTEGREYPPDELISIPSGLSNRHALEIELSQPTFTTSKNGKIMVDKKPNGSASPNLADACTMAYWPVQRSGFVYF